MQALLQSNARADAADSDGYDPARDHWSRFHGHKWLRDGEWLWLPTMVRLGVNVPLWLGLMAIGVMGMGGVSVAVSTVGLALHLWRVNGPRRAAWNIARVPTGWLDERRG